MDFPFGNAVASAHAHATEDEQHVLGALRTLLPEAVDVGKSTLKGHHGNPITAFEAKVDRRAVLRELWGRMAANMRAGTLDEIRRTLPTRVDETCRLYLRFDKQLAYNGELALTESGDAIHLELKVAAFPARQRVAIETVERFIGECPGDEGEAQVHRF